jgi:hypothetical protein
MIKNTQKITVLKDSTNEAKNGLATKPKKGKAQPPKNANAVKSDIRIMLQYSAKKNIAKIIAEYSTL